MIACRRKIGIVSQQVVFSEADLPNVQRKGALQTVREEKHESIHSNLKCFFGGVSFHLVACTCFIYSHKKINLLEWNVWEIIEVI